MRFLRILLWGNAPLFLCAGGAPKGCGLNEPLCPEGYSRVYAQNSASCVRDHSIEAGGSCFSSLNCNTDLYCKSGGVCAPRKKQGEACDAYFSCEANLTCNRAYSPPVCKPPGAEGEKCSNAAECSTGLICHPVSKECAKRGDQGAACDNLLDCKVGLVCLVNRTCGDRGSEGAFCDSLVPVSQPCKAGLFCLRKEYEHVCLPPRPIGERCHVNEHCASELFCGNRLSETADDGKCVARGENGSRCHSDRECKDGFSCVSETTTGARQCLRKSRDGEPCVHDQSCATGLVCNTSFRTPVCKAPHSGGAGDACPDNSFCRTGFSCENHVCVQDAPRVGVECTFDSQCDAPLRCNQSTFPATCQKGDSGERCLYDDDCATGLLCKAKTGGYVCAS